MGVKYWRNVKTRGREREKQSHGHERERGRECERGKDEGGGGVKDGEWHCVNYSIGVEDCEKEK